MGYTEQEKYDYTIFRFIKYYFTSQPKLLYEQSISVHYKKLNRDRDTYLDFNSAKKKIINMRWEKELKLSERAINHILNPCFMLE